MKIIEKLDDLIGNTPLFRAKNIEKAEGLNATLLFKLEYLNPAGSVKDRAGLFMLNDAEKKGKIKKGGTIIEPTSGNTGIGLASLGISRGYKVILTMPDTMSVERISLLRGYGATVILTDGKLGMKGAIDKANEINANTPNSVIMGQFDNPANTMAHYMTTGPEIYNDTDGKVDMFIAGVGSGGTVSGTGKYLKEQDKNIKVIAVEPESSPMITKGISGAHKIQGIGANFIPKNYDSSVVDEVVDVSDDMAIKYAKMLGTTEGILVGISSGASIYTAVMMAKRKENKGKTIVALLPDTGDRYLSTELFKN